MIIAVIPARGGSKRIERKNIIDFCGKPMIGWSIEAAIKSKCFDEIIVSTDDDEIASISELYGANIYFKRPRNISDDFATTGEVMSHAIEWFAKNIKEPEYVCCIYATAPLIDYKKIREGYELIRNSNLSFVFSATSYSYPIQRSFFLDQDLVKMFFPKEYNKRSQDLENSYHDAGQFYWGKTDSWINNEKVFSMNSKIIYLKPDSVQDIDTYDDLKLATFKHQLMFKSN